MNQPSVPADDPANSGGIVRCTICNKATIVSVSDIVGFIRSGWPRCCGYVMTLAPARQANDSGNV